MTDIHRKLPYKKFALMTVAILFLGLVAVEFWKDSQTYTVTQGERNNGFGNTYGYKIENYRYSHAMRITIWIKLGTSTIMKSVYEMPRLTIDKVGGTAWIESDGAIYVKLRIIDHSSLDSIHSTRLIYDYHTGQMYVTSDLTLWRIWSRTLSKDDWISEKEFDETLTELQQ
jgi:hypothetical protein